jgi:hypothetical protein
MAAIVTAKDFGSVDTENYVVTRVREFMAQYPGDWTVGFLGAASNTIWEMTVTAPDGIKRRVKLYAEDGDHGIDNIFSDLRNVVQRHAAGGDRSVAQTA